MIRFLENTAYTLDVRSLWHTTFLQDSLDFALTIPERIGIDIIGVAQGEPLSGSIELQSLSEGILVTGTLGYTTVGECARCLADISQQVETPFTQLYVYHDPEDDEELYQCSDYCIDLEQGIRTAIIDQLPHAPLCTNDCAGLCDQCGHNFNEDPVHVHDTIDPRFAALEKLFHQHDTSGIDTSSSSS